MSVSATNAATPVRVQSLSQFVDEVRKMRKAWGIDEHIDLWFRGEGKKYPHSVLRPALYRPPSDRVTDMKEVPELLRIEAKLYEEFKRIGLQLINGSVRIEDEEWDWYFLMRHHSAPTRLLDWSDGALVALHFALKEKTRDAMSRVKPEGQEQLVPCVYVLDPDRLKNALRRATDDYRHEKENWERYVEKHPYFTHGEDSGEAWELAYIPGDTTELQLLPIPSPPLVMDFPHISRRVAAQRSRFVVLGSDPDCLAKECKRQESSIQIIEIDPNPENLLKLRSELRDCGVTESVIYPDLDGLGRELTQLWEDLKIGPTSFGM